jgi:5-methylcytosine-specific restriction endonuclease McrA
MKRNLQTCSVDGCEELEKQRGLCSSHYMQAWRSGSLEVLADTCKGKICGFKGCDLPARKKGLCNSHYTSLWRKLNPEKAKIAKRNSWRRRRARKLGATGSHSDAEFGHLLESYCGLCAYCNERAESEDHVVPLINGGTDDIMNIAPACLRCNKRKNDTEMLVWLLKERVST